LDRVFVLIANLRLIVFLTVNFVRRIALNARYAITHRYRQRRMRELCEQNRAPISVLFYHRVAECCPNEWSISTNQFLQHIQYVRQNFEIIGLEEVQRRIASGDSPRPAVAITFDDGYADNMAFALPYLIREQIPCTYFVTTEHIRNGRPFAHDEQSGQPLAPNSIEDLRHLQASGVEIGLHTANHIDFNLVTNRRVLEAEIVEAKLDLEMMLGEQVKYLAVPFGLPQQMRPAVIETARMCGLQGICSAYGAYNTMDGDAFHIRRIHGDPDFVRLRNWLSFDERKLRQEPALLTQDVLIETEWEAASVSDEHSLVC
jgi:peptidoglycan/xylan/chitin deacetylase (PgdA/CDA1 family)